ncbi:MAG: hypothetical protein JF614_24565 [Acidobacteria bacterium]|nr:hypothetical protein [Acidobacteriota bacterium]
MSQRNRIPCAAITLVAALFVAAPTPSSAARLPAGRLPTAGVWERAWSWLAGLGLPGGGALPGLAALWEKEGGMIDPNGQTKTAAPVPPPPATLLNSKPDGIQ